MNRTHIVILLSLLVSVAAIAGLQACGSSSSTSSDNVTIKGAGR